MSAAAISGMGALGANQAARGSGFGDIQSEEFVKILITELTNQDPLEPNDSAQILEQLSSLRNIESQMALQDKLEAMVMQNQLAQAGGMIGKVVEGLDLTNNAISGEVVSVRVVSGEAVLELDTGKNLMMGRITRIAGTSTTPAARL